MSRNLDSHLVFKIWNTSACSDFFKDTCPVILIDVKSAHGRSLGLFTDLRMLGALQVYLFLFLLVYFIPEVWTTLKAFWHHSIWNMKSIRENVSEYFSLSQLLGKLKSKAYACIAILKDLFMRAMILDFVWQHACLFWDSVLCAWKKKKAWTSMS